MLSGTLIVGTGIAVSPISGSLFKVDYLPQTPMYLLMIVGVIALITSFFGLVGSIKSLSSLPALPRDSS